MSTYISSFIEPVFRHARRFSRSTQEADAAPLGLVQASRHDRSALSYDQPAVMDTESRQEMDMQVIDPPASHGQFLDRIPPDDDDDADEMSDALSPMSLGSPAEFDLRRLDGERMLRMRQGPFGASGEAEDGTAGSARARGRTDPLPRRPVQRLVNTRRHTNGQMQGQTPPVAVAAASMPNAVGPGMQAGAGELQYFDDPIASRSVRMSVGGGERGRPSIASLDPSTPSSPAHEQQQPHQKPGMALPDDDGMRTTRERIQAVQAMDISPEEKGRLVYGIMTEKWMTGQHDGHRALLRDDVLGRPLSPATASLRSQEAPMTPVSGRSTMDGVQGPSGEAIASPSTSLFTEPGDEELMVGPEDLRPTYWKKLSVEVSAEKNVPQCQDEEMEIFPDEDLLENDDDYEEGQEQDQEPFGCAHYKRNVKLQCVDCHRWYTCRFCHDAAEGHSLVRHRTRNMLCMFCGTAQRAAKSCRSCHRTAATYYCNVCKLWDDDGSKKIYHCDDCGICRIGEGLGKDFFHCPTCDACIDISIRDTHRCIERSIDCDCPICGDYMFNSQTTVVFMKCGHSIHHACYKQHLKRNYRCPICAKSILNMEMTFRNLDRAIESQPMPEELRHTKAIVHCNDCRCRTSVPYHWLGLKCDECESYNTVKISIIGPDGTGDASSVVAVAAVTTAATVVAEDAAHADARQGSEVGVGGGGGGGGGGDVRDSRRQNITVSRGLSNDILTGNRSRRPTSTGGIYSARAAVAVNEFGHAANGGSRSVSALGADRVRSERAGASRRPSVPSDDEYGQEDEELDFWGGDLSPRLRALPAPGAAVQGKFRRAEEPVEQSDSSDDDFMNDNPDDLDDEEDEDENDDEMEIFGHR